MNAGVTDDYIGRDYRDAWAERLNSADASAVDLFGPEMAPSPYKKRKLPSRDINEFCEAKGLDKTARHNRETARKHLGQEQHDRWAACQRSLLTSGQGPSTPVVAPLPTPPTGKIAMRHPLQDIPNESRTGDTVCVAAQADPGQERTNGAVEPLVRDGIDEHLREFASDVLGVEPNATGDGDEDDGVRRTSLYGDLRSPSTSLTSSRQPHESSSTISRKSI